MFLTGYHGTTLVAAHSILEEGAYHLSTRDTEWLGSGIYFYPSFSDAYNWETIDGRIPAEAILHSVIKVKNTEYLDFDSDKGHEIYQAACALISEMQGKEISANLTESQTQCAIAKIVWDIHDEIKVLAASFPTEKKKVRAIKEARKYRKEFCVRDNSYIKHTYIIERRNLDG